MIVADLDPVGGYLPLHEIGDNIILTETRVLRSAQQSLDVIRVGLYNVADGQRYQAMRADGSVWDNGEVLIPVQPAASASEVCPPPPP